jgi:hypothetical protein
MNSIVIPSPDAIPIHWAWFQVLLIFTAAARCVTESR